MINRIESIPDLTPEERQGVQAIQYLQSLDPDISPKDSFAEALDAWRNVFDDRMRRKTMTVYTTLKPSQNN